MSATTIGIGLLERERRRQRLSAAALARRMGVSRSAISQVERGAQHASGPFKEKAAEALGVAIADLWPEHFVIVRERRRSGSTLELLHDRDGRIVAFSTEARAKRALAVLREQGLSDIGVRGPLRPTSLAILYGIGEDETPGRLLVDAKPNSLNVDGAAPPKSRAVKTSAGTARDVSQG